MEESEYLSNNHTERIYIGSLDGFEFERLCGRIFSKLGYGDVKLTSPVKDEGKDIVISSSEGRVLIECKHHLNSSIGRPTVQKLHSAIIAERAIKGIIVTTGFFSTEAISYIREHNLPIELIDKNILCDLATRAGIELIDVDKEDAYILSFPVSSTETMENNLCLFIEKKIYSYPIPIREKICIKKREISLLPVYLIKYKVDAVFYTTVGCIHREQSEGLFFLDGDTLKYLDKNVANYLNGLPIEKLIDRSNIDSMTVHPFKRIINEVKEQAVNIIKAKHTAYVRYKGNNNQVYSMKCIPKKRDIFIYAITQIYVAMNQLLFKFSNQQKNISMIDGGNKGFYPLDNEGNIFVCDICSKKITKKGILCNDCGAVVHTKHFFRTCGFSCSLCKKTICRNCAFYYRKYLFLRIVVCKECKERLLIEKNIYCLPFKQGA